MKPADLERAGRIWTALQRAECEGLLIMTDSYIQTRESVQSFALMKWSDFGSQLQNTIAVALFNFLSRCHKVK